MELGASSPTRISLVGGEGHTQLGVERLVELRERVRRATSLLVLEGKQGSFCDGLALDSLVDATGPEASAALGEYAALLAELDRAPYPVLAVVDGAAFGGGVGLAAVADVVIASPNARFGLPEIYWGLLPAVALAYVARRVGPARARLLALGATTLDAEAAFQAGLVDEITEELGAAAERYARRLRRAAPHAVAEIKRHLVAVTDPAVHAAEARRRFDALLATGDTTARLRRLAAGDVPWHEDPA
jgi:enoyl-CoA hydratase/carnithine racemase